MTDWKVGDRCQRGYNEGEFEVGAVTAVVTAEREKPRSYMWDNYNPGKSPGMETYVDHIMVKWDNGTEEKTDPWKVYPEDTEVERAFRKIAREATARIDAKLSEAMRALDEAEKISEETGIPFSSGISPLGQSYIPHSMNDIHSEVDSEFIRDITEAYGYEDGWQHSAVCY